MIVTQFMPIFLVLLFWSARGPKDWVGASLLASFFQGASPFVLSAAGRDIGIAPAYLLLAVGLIHWFRHRRIVFELRSQRLSSAHLWLGLFTLIGVLGSVLLPLVFDGQVDVLPVRGALGAQSLEAVHFGVGNLIQAAYLLANAMMFSLAARFAQVGSVTARQALNSLGLGALLASLLGLYQFAGGFLQLPWPSDIINSNTGVGQFPDQMFGGGVHRITSTFWEPVLLAFHFVGLVAVLLFGGVSPFVGAICLVVLFLSTSTAAYFGVLLTLVMALAMQPETALLRKSLVAVILVAVVFFVFDQSALNGAVLDSMILNKASSSSGVERSHANLMALQAALDSFGLGAGIGSSRGSSILATLIACTGIPGVLCFVAFVVQAVRMCERSSLKEVRAIGLGLIGFCSVWILAVPDTVQAMFWLVAGVGVGSAVFAIDSPRHAESFLNSRHQTFEAGSESALSGR